MGKYDLSPLFRLSADSLKFLETFILNRGNVKEMERNTGQSYWAIRRRLDEVIEEMDLESEPVQRNLRDERKAILAKLKTGEVDAHQAAELLRQLGKDSE
jgi:hypothetical protein